MTTRPIVLTFLRTVLVAGGAGVLCFAQQPQYPPPPQQYPPQDPQQQQYPQQQQQQYPPQQQIPQGYPQPQYPAGQGQYPPQQPGPYSQPPLMPPQQLDQLVASIALYPDGLLAHVLTAASFSNQIPEAAGWANQHAYLRGEGLAQAIRQDNLPWDVSVLALLPFPQVLSQMAQYMSWTQQLGDAVLAQRGDVMDAVQRRRQQANQYGYLRDPQFSQYERVQIAGPGDIEIVPLTNDYYVPYYNPLVVYAAPRRGFVGGVFNFGPAVSLGFSFNSWGWGGGVGFGWREHNILIDRQPWARTWTNRAVYAHPYATPYRPGPGPRIEHHEYNNRPAERAHEERREEHRDEHEHHDH
jgi:Protein of unknown function (DUF3300)